MWCMRHGLLIYCCPLPSPTTRAAHPDTMCFYAMSMLCPCPGISPSALLTQQVRQLEDAHAATIAELEGINAKQVAGLAAAAAEMQVLQQEVRQCIEHQRMVGHHFLLYQPGLA